MSQHDIGITLRQAHQMREHYQSIVDECQQDLALIDEISQGLLQDPRYGQQERSRDLVMWMTESARIAIRGEIHAAQSWVEAMRGLRPLGGEEAAGDGP